MSFRLYILWTEKVLANRRCSISSIYHTYAPTNMCMYCKRYMFLPHSWKNEKCMSISWEKKHMLSCVFHLFSNFPIDIIRYQGRLLTILQASMLHLRHGVFLHLIQLQASKIWVNSMADWHTRLDMVPSEISTHKIVKLCSNFYLTKSMEQLINHYINWPPCVKSL